ncbi:MAG: 16S rRNA (adenine(1518)-N(6)/adenine(1519)-N(6))-dimethyltransferase RsmA, partial [Alphaproteobacteria bacterium]
REVIAAHGLAARKSLGQHFLLDLNLTRRIARAAGALDAGSVIEIGPGPGGLTRGLLLEGARDVVAIERDERCQGALAELAAAFPGRLKIIGADALQVDTCALARTLTPPVKLVANLPYNIATALLLGWLKDVSAFASLTVMVQKEVAERLAAKPRTKAYGRLAVICQWLCAVRLLFDVAPRAFVPPPKVTSTVVQLTPRPQPLGPARFAALETVTASAFGQRRKMLRSSLKTLGVDVARLVAMAGVDAQVRAEELAVEQFCALARAYDALAAAPTGPRADP